jgi:hypothetical protein
MREGNAFGVFITKCLGAFFDQWGNNKRGIETTACWEAQ